jgi:RNA polymerase sigma factor (sigma-70 family)
VVAADGDCDGRRVPPTHERAGPPGLAGLGDERLAALAAAGSAAAFEAIYARHRTALLAYCGRLLASREDAEDAVQQTFLRAHVSLRTGSGPRVLRPWLYAIARNRCLTLLAGRGPAARPIAELECGAGRLLGDVERRAMLRELVADLLRLPPDQRAALVLSQLGAFRHAEIGLALGCPERKVRALIFQARATLTAERDARDAPCADVRRQLAGARGGALRRASLQRHLRLCEPCRSARPGLLRNRPTSAAAGGS